MLKTLLLILLFYSCGYSQERLQNSAYVELLGSGGLYSLNYERVIGEQNSLRIGVSYVDLSHSLFDLKYVSFPILINRFFFSPRNQIEVSGGIVLVAKQESSAYDGSSSLYEDIDVLNGSTYIGYRDWNESRRIIFRIGCSQLFNQHGILVSGGLSLGYLF